MGVAIMLVAVGVISSPEENFNAPRWVLFVAGLAFFVAGVSMVLPAEPRRLRLAVVALIPTCLGILGAYAAYDGQFEDEGGPLPFVSEETNRTIGRVIFGTGALFCFWLTTMALRGKGHVAGDSNAPNSNDVSDS